MKQTLKLAGMALVLCSSVATAKASVITYDLTGPTPGISGDYTFTYAVKNNSLGNPITFFTIYFSEFTFPDGSVPEYSGLKEIASPSGWTFSSVEPSAPNLCGYVEWSGVSGIALGGSVAGFQATFNFSGSGNPGTQYFEIYNDNLELLDSGHTTPVPEPSTWLAGIFAFALLAGGGVRGVAKTRGSAEVHTPLA